MAKEYKYSDETKHVNAQCKVVVYPWLNILNNPDLSDTELAKASRLDISSQVQSVTYSKNMAGAGSFSIQLTNSPQFGTNDWKDILKRGYWVVIYMTNDGDLLMNSAVGPAKSRKGEAKRIRCVGYIERVGVSGVTQENRSIDIGFNVTGRDFGIVYEETNIWHNLFAFDKLLLDSVAQTKLNITGNVRVHEAIKLIHDLFYFPLNIDGMQSKLKDNKSLLSIGLQWLMPKEMLSDIGFDLRATNKGTYWGALPNIFKIEETGAGISVEQPGDYLNGNAWEQLKRLSIPPFHELFTEHTDSGLPQLTFRPIPWGMDQANYPKNKSKIKLYKDIKEVVYVPAIDLYDFDLGEDDHSRYNSFLATVSTTLINTEDNIGLLVGKGFPKNNSASIRRHGFRPMHVTVDSIVKNEELGNGKADQIQLTEFNEILYDYWNNAVFAESGSVSKLGTNDVRVGKCMKFRNDVPYLCTKRYYIEGYTDTFTVNAKRETEWTQDVDLTRGFEEADLAAKKGFLNRNTPFSASGEFTKGEGENK